MRDRLDNFVLQQAQAEVAEGEKICAVQQDEWAAIVWTESGRELRGRYLIGADGANSVVARAVGLRRTKRLGAALEAELPADDTRMREYAGEAVFVFGIVEQGYLWIFPKRNHLSVGIGVFRKGQQELKAPARQPLLVTLEESGLVLPSLCRSGECSMCRVKVTSGKVYQPAGALVRKSDRSCGYVHACVAYPLESLELAL